jgi:hypothetical protein
VIYEFSLLTPGRPDRSTGREEIRRGFGAAWCTRRLLLVMWSATAGPCMCVIAPTRSRCVGAGASGRGRGQPYRCEVAGGVPTRLGPSFKGTGQLALGSAEQGGRRPRLQRDE